MAEQAEITEALSAQSLDDTARFFAENKGVTQENCNQFAARLLGLPVQPTLIQGTTSYTVMATGGGSAVIQFRSTNNLLNLRKLSLVKETYERFIPKHEPCGELNGVSAVKIDYVDGVSVFLAMKSLHAAGSQLLKVALMDFANFIALAWRNRPTELSETSTRNNTYTCLRADLELLDRGLPERFRPKVGSLLEELDGLFAVDWPMVVTHGDLVENNMHFNPNTGNLEGVIDWNDAMVAPFGTSVIGINCLLGWYAGRQRLWVDNAAELREGFWAELARAVGPGFDRRRVSAAAQIGLFRTYGLVMGERGKAAVQEGSLSLQYLEDHLPFNSYYEAQRDFTPTGNNSLLKKDYLASVRV